VYGAGPVVREAISLGIEYAWMNSGQTCAAWTPMPVPASRHEEVVELAVAAAEAVAIAGNSIYGLSGSVFGEPDHALAVAKRTRTGQVMVNNGEFNLSAPFGGTSRAATAGSWAGSGWRSFSRSRPSTARKVPGGTAHV
jgi:acyl-CoA reductase-like NAD-dependent aldehyde dehydrogenase